MTVKIQLGIIRTQVKSVYSYYEYFQCIVAFESETFFLSISKLATLKGEANQSSGRFGHYSKSLLAAV